LLAGKQSIAIGRIFKRILNEDVIEVDGQIREGAPEGQINLRNLHLRFQVRVDFPNDYIANLIFVDVENNGNQKDKAEQDPEEPFAKPKKPFFPHTTKLGDAPTRFAATRYTY